MKPHLYTRLAGLVGARIRCEETGNTEWFQKHTDAINYLVKNHMPSGSGIDTGTKMDLGASKPDRLVFLFGYHHMNESGMYDGWTDHTLIVTPSLASGISLRITGRDRNQVKEYLYETYHQDLLCQTYRDYEPAQSEMKGGAQ